MSHDADALDSSPEEDTDRPIPDDLRRAIFEIKVACNGIVILLEQQHHHIAALARGSHPNLGNHGSHTTLGPYRAGSGADVLSDVQPDYTPAGGVRIDPRKWERIQQSIDEIERSKRRETDRAEGFRAALKSAEKKSDAFRKRVTFFIAVAVPAGGFIEYVLQHVLHW